MAIGVFITFKLLNFADLTVDGTLALGGAVAVMLIINGYSPVVVLIVSFIAGMAAGLITGLLHTVFGIPDILAGILTQISLYSINLHVMGKSNQAVSVDKYNLILTQKYSECHFGRCNICCCYRGDFILVFWDRARLHHSCYRLK